MQFIPLVNSESPEFELHFAAGEQWFDRRQLGATSPEPFQLEIDFEIIIVTTRTDNFFSRKFNARLLNQDDVDLIDYLKKMLVLWLAYFVMLIGIVACVSKNQKSSL